MPADIRVPVDPIFLAFGVPATVTRPEPDDTPISTTVVWNSGTTEDAFGPMALQRRERRYVVSIRRDQVPTLPRGSFVDAPELLGGEIKRWRVDEMEQADSDIARCVVVPERDLVTTEPEI